jgi:hypothetical protein
MAEIVASGIAEPLILPEEHVRTTEIAYRLIAAGSSSRKGTKMFDEKLERGAQPPPDDQTLEANVDLNRRQLLHRLAIAGVSVAGLTALTQQAAQATLNLHSGAYDSWIHAVNVVLEGATEGVTITRSSSYAQVDHPGGGELWCHFAIPTPVIFSGDRLRINDGRIVFDTAGPQALVRRMDVFDGATHRATRDQVALSGPHPLETIPVPGQPYVSMGICVSILLSFSQPGWVRFFGAGAQFL